MQMGRKGALVLLALVALWAAKPAFACLTAVTPPSCCQGTMPGCDDSTTMANMTCCQSQSPENAIPAAMAAACSAPAVQMVTLPVDAVDSAQAAGVIASVAGASPSPPPPGFSSILRI
jgi:hypothetical protein